MQTLSRSKKSKMASRLPSAGVGGKNIVYFSNVRIFLSSYFTGTKEKLSLYFETVNFFVGIPESSKFNLNL